MHLNELPLIFALVGLALYTVLGGADFGAGLWQLSAGRGPAADRIRDHAHHSIAPVWEANHVWLIFVLTVVWTAYPTAFGSIASTLAAPLFIAAIGIIFRGTTYALQSAAADTRERRVIDTVFALSSILTPFALGTAVGGIASRRVPVGNAAGNLVTSWLNPTSIMVGALAVAVGAFLAAVYLCADARKLGEPDLERRFQIRALGAGVVAGAMALGGLIVLHSDAYPLYHGLIYGDGLPMVIISALAGVAALVAVLLGLFELSRYVAGVAVMAILFGWALAQRPLILPGLTIARAAAPHDTLVAVVVAVLAGGLILFPSLALLFGLVLSGRFTRQPAVSAVSARSSVVRASRSGLAGRSAAGCLVVGLGLLTIAEAGWAHVIGVLALLGFAVLAFLAIEPTEIAESD